MSCAVGRLAVALIAVPPTLPSGLSVGHSVEIAPSTSR
jgi:hypothetical protein